MSLSVNSRDRRRFRRQARPRCPFARHRLQPAVLDFLFVEPATRSAVATQRQTDCRWPGGIATRFTAEQILGKGGTTAETATFLPFAGSAADKALNDGAVDVVWIIGVPEATAVQSFLRNLKVRLMSFPMAEAFTRLFPDLNRLILSQGVVDIDKNIPPVDIQLIGTTSKILIRNDLHPEIVQLLLQTMKEVHSGSDIFHRNGEYPNGTDAEYTIAATAIDFYRNGPSFMQRHLPLLLSVHVQRAIAVLVTALAIGFPLFRFLPQLLQLDDASASCSIGTLDANSNDKQLAEKKAEIDRIGTP